MNSLFDNNIQYSDDAIQPNESHFEWFQRSEDDHVRGEASWLNQQYQSLTDDDVKHDIRNRFRNKRIGQHCGAAFELLIYGLFTGLGFDVRADNPVDNKSRLDWIIQQETTPIAKIEATTVEIDEEFNTNGDRMFNLLEETGKYIRVPGFQIDVISFTVGNENPSPKKLATRLDQEFKNCTQNNSGSFESKIKIWNGDGSGWGIEYKIVKPNSPGINPDRIWCGLSSGEVRYVGYVNPIRKAVRHKLRQHSSQLSTPSETPFIIAISSIYRQSVINCNIMRWAAGGTPGYLFSDPQSMNDPVEGEAFINPDGIWTKPMRNGGVRSLPDGIISVSHCETGMLDTTKIILWTNPYYEKECVIPDWPYDYATWDSTTGKIIKKEKKRDWVIPI